MAHKQPEIKEIQARIIADIESRLGQQVPFFKKAAWRVLAWALAGVFSIIYKYIDYRSIQVFVQTADEIGLGYWGEIYDVNRGQSQASKFTVLIKGPSDLQVKAGSQYIKNTTGVIYRQLETVSLSTGEATVTVVATESGVKGNLEVGDTIAPINPIGIEKNVAITSIVSTGTDAEDINVWRQRIIDRIRNPPQGGSLSDYVIWATEPTGIKRAFPMVGEPGIVWVYCESSTEKDGIPTQAQLDEAEESIRQPYRLPMTAGLEVKPIERLSFDVEVIGLSPSGTDVQSAIKQAIELFMIQREPFIKGLSTLPKKDEVSVNLVLSQVVFAIGAYAATFNSIKLYLNGSEITSHSLNVGELAKLGELTYPPGA